MRENLKHMNFGIVKNHIQRIFEECGFYGSSFKEDINNIYNCYQQIANHYKETNTFDFEQLNSLCTYLDKPKFGMSNNKFKFYLLAIEDRLDEKENFSYQIAKALQMYCIYEDKIMNAPNEEESERHKSTLMTLINHENFIDKKLLTEFEYIHTLKTTLEDVSTIIQILDAYKLGGCDKLEKECTINVTFEDVVLTEYLSKDLIDSVNYYYDTPLDYKYVDLMKAIAVDNSLLVDNVSIDLSSLRFSDENNTKYTCSLFNPKLVSEKGITDVEKGYAKVEIVIYPFLNSFDFVGVQIKDGKILEDAEMILDEPLDEKLKEYSIKDDYGTSF